MQSHKANLIEPYLRLIDLGNTLGHSSLFKGYHSLAVLAEKDALLRFHPLLSPLSSLSALIPTSS